MPYWVWAAWLFLSYGISNYIAIRMHKYNVKRNTTKFLRLIKIENPDSAVTFISVESSDIEAMAKIEQMYKEFSK